MNYLDMQRVLAMISKITGIMAHTGHAMTCAEADEVTKLLALTGYRSDAEALIADHIGSDDTDSAESHQAMLKMLPDEQNAAIIRHVHDLATSEHTADGPITGQYGVVFRWAGGDKQTTTVPLTENYTTFEDVRLLIAVPLGCKPEDVEVLALWRMDLLDQALDEVSTAHAEDKQDKAAYAG